MWLAPALLYKVFQGAYLASRVDGLLRVEWQPGRHQTRSMACFRLLPNSQLDSTDQLYQSFSAWKSAASISACITCRQLLLSEGRPSSAAAIQIIKNTITLSIVWK